MFKRTKFRSFFWYERGYYNNVLKRVEEIKQQNPKINRYELYEMACTESKEEWLQKQNEY